MVDIIIRNKNKRLLIGHYSFDGFKLNISSVSISISRITEVQRMVNIITIHSPTDAPINGNYRCLGMTLQDSGAILILLYVSYRDQNLYC